MWRFSDWGYFIEFCTAEDYILKFPVTPPAGVDKTWEVTITPGDVKIKCNTLEVLHFIFDNTFNEMCTSFVKGRIATSVVFRSEDTATKMFTAEQIRK